MGYDFSYFNENKAGQLATTLQAARAKIYKDVMSKRSKADILDFEAQLNAIFAIKKPQSYSDMGVADAQEYLGGEFVETVLNKIETIKLEANAADEKDNRSSFERTTLLTSINNAVWTLQMLANKMKNLPSNINTNELKALLQEMGHNVAKAKNILNNDANFQRFQQTKKERFARANAKDIINLINYLNAFVKTMNAPTESMKDVGDKLENWLTDIANDFIDRNTYGIVNGTKTGADSIRRGNEIVSYVVSEETLSDPKLAAPYGFSAGKLTMTYDPGTAKQGKADVVYTSTEPSLKDSFRLSAKNWSHGYGDLGSTSIDAGITRSSSVSTAEAYKIAVINKVKTMDKIANDAHDFAKLALAADIAMGISQGIQGADKGGYANLLVINTGSRIVVKDLADIVFKVAEGAQHLTGYDESEIEGKASDIYQRINAIVKKGRTNTYLGLMTSALNKMKVTIYVSARS